MEIDYAAIGKRIRKARKKQHLTQEQLAEMIGVKPAHISNIESGKKPFSFHVFVRLYKVLKVNPDSLLLSHGERRDVVMKEKPGDNGMVAISGCEALREAVDTAVMQWWKEHVDI